MSKSDATTPITPNIGVAECILGESTLKKRAFTSPAIIDNATARAKRARETEENAIIGSPSTSHVTPFPEPKHFWPRNIVPIIKAIQNTDCPCPSPPLFKFELTKEAAARNFCILTKFNMSIEKALEAQASSPLGYGSEFRKPDTLRPLLQLHPNWERFERLLKNGSDWPLDPISEEEREQDVHEALEFGNHKGAELEPDLLTSLVNSDVTYGFAVPFPLHKMLRVPGILFAPLNIQDQNTIDSTGRIVPTKRLTHDQSFKFSASGTSVNSRTRKDDLLPCVYGGVVRRLVNWAVAARRKHPTTRIFATKIDFKSAYRRLHVSASIAKQSVTQLPREELALMALRLTFGGAPCPFEWGVISETICDLATAIIRDDDWNPNEVHAPKQEEFPPPIFLPDDIPLAEGKELIVDVDVHHRGTHDIYIDDLVGLGLDLPNCNNRERSEAAPLLAIDTCSRRVDAGEPIPRHNMAALHKLSAEGRLEEIKMILGWLWDFRRLIISLPVEKFTAWSSEINKMISNGETTSADLESTIGRLTHVSMILPPVHHFLSRLRELLAYSKRVNKRKVKLTPECVDDLKLMNECFLRRAHHGISMNMIGYRKPTHVYRSDSCPAGIGGYNNEGFAWRFEIPSNLKFRASNNLLEHLASIISPWIDLIAGRLVEGDCSLSMTDSTTSEGWTRKTNFKEKDEGLQATIRIEVARGHASRFMWAGVREYSQWFPGKENQVADALSRDWDRTDAELTKILFSHVPSQVPTSFKIVQLPNEISSYVTSLLQRLPVQQQYSEEHKLTTLGRGSDGGDTASQQELAMTTSSKESQGISNPSSLAPLLWQCEKGDFLEHLMAPWLVKQSVVPSITWQRPSGVTDTLTHHMTPMET